MADWTAGTITVPAAPGAVSVDLAFQPQCVIFMGTNFTAEDTVVTPASQLGLFRGFACRNYLTGTIDEYAVAGATAGGWCIALNTVSVLMGPTTGPGNQLFAGNCTFDIAGFTVAFSTAAAGGYKVVYLAVADFNNFVSIGEQHSFLADVGFVPESFLHSSAVRGSPVYAPNPTTGVPANNEFSHGGARFDGSGSTGYSGSAMTFPASASAQYALDLRHFTSIVGMGGNFLGPFLITDWIYAQLSPVGSSTLDFHSDSTTYGMGVCWDGESYGGFATAPAVAGDETVVSDYPFAPAALISYTLGDEPNGQGTGGFGGFGISVTTRDFIWSVLIDGFHNYAVQSYQTLVSGVGAGGYSAAEVTLTDNGFILETVVDTNAPSPNVFHGFGPPPSPWVPQLYRWQLYESFVRG